MKRRGSILALLLALALVSGAFTVSGETPDDHSRLRQQIIDSVESGESFFTTEYGMTVEELQEVYSDLYNAGQLPWYADTYFDWSNNADGIVTVFYPRGMKANGFNEQRYEQAMAELLAECCHEGMEPWQMALSVHDYIAAHCAYDETVIRNTGYQALVLGASACYGYAQLYMDVMHRIGIPCQIAVAEDTGNGVGHAWNVIELDGVWYHLDVTWADSVPDMFGNVGHSYFLKSDEQYRNGSGNHYFDWETDAVCEGGAYCSIMFWSNLNSPVIFVDCDTMILRKTTKDGIVIVSRHADTGEETVLYEVEQQWLNLGDGEYLYPTRGLSFWNGRLYFGTEDTVYSMLPDGSGLRQEYVWDVGESNLYIIGTLVDDGMLWLELSDGEFSLTEHQVILEEEYHSHSYSKTKIDATCTMEGYEEYACDCGIDYRCAKVDCLGHDYEEDTLDGAILYTCSRCGYCWEEEIPAPSTVPPETNPAPEPVRQDSAKEGGIRWTAVAVRAALTAIAIVLVFRMKKGKINA